MPRVRVAVSEYPAIPHELFEPDNAAWASETGTRAWLKRHGLRMPLFDGGGPVTRVHWAAQAWGIANGLAVDGRRYLDWHKVAAAGLPQYAHQSIKERLALMS